MPERRALQHQPHPLVLKLRARCALVCMPPGSSIRQIDLSPPREYHQLQRQRPAFRGHQRVSSTGSVRRTPTCSACRRPRRRNTSSHAPELQAGGLPRLVQGCDHEEGLQRRGHLQPQAEPDEVRTSLGWAPFDDEGRYIEARFGNLSVVSFYIPSGSSGDAAPGLQVRRDAVAQARSSTNGCTAAATTCCAATGTSSARATTSRTGPRTRRTPAACPRSARGSTRQIADACGDGTRRA